MRYVVNPQLRFGQVPVEDIVLNLDSRSDIEPILLAVQLLHSNPAFMAAASELLDSEIQPHVDKGQGRPGMDM